MELKVTCTRCDCEVIHDCGSDLQSAILDLYGWRPEGGFPPELTGPMRSLIGTMPDGSLDVDQPDVPFLSECYLYPLLGKDDARTLRALIRNVIEASGLDPRFLEAKACEALTAKTKAGKTPKPK